MANSESVGKKIVEALKKQAENIDIAEDVSFETEADNALNIQNDDIFS